MPVIVLPQFFLCGLLVPVDQMAGWLQVISHLLPLTYAVKALQEVGQLRDGHRRRCGSTSRVVAGAALLALALAAATLRRRTN